jgi:two-component system OmpR family sensor kinase/two-component system sensor histidine kinase BaeS
VVERGPREIRGVARAFNSMSERLAASEEQRRRLLADVSHELRTPLTVLQGNIEALVDGVHPADKTHLEGLLDETGVLSRLVEDLRTLSLAEAGALSLHREPTDIPALASDTVAAFGRRAREAGIGLETASSHDVPPVSVDPVRVREVLTNLVSNSLHHTLRGGKVTIAVARDGDRAVAISVSDTGTGMSEETLGKIFDRFYKSADSRGAGLGLAIARRLVDAHGGAIEATSVMGEGTTIRFTLPIESA